MDERHTNSFRRGGGSAGFTLIELLIVMALVVGVGGAIVVFQKDLFSVNDFLQQSLSLQRDAEAVVRAMMSELRTATQSGIGGYPFEITGSSSIAFYANVDSDASVERIHYFVSGTDLWKSVVKPAGNPLTYSTTTAQEMLLVVMRGVAASSTPPFLYYDRFYAGTTTPLVQPVDAGAVRLVRVTLAADRDIARLPPPVVVSSQVNIRNLKDN